MPTIGVCTSALETSIQALLTHLRETSNANIKFVKLPYNDVGSYRLDSMNVDGIILCHSIHNRRFGITDVMDALYDEFLPNARRVFGRDNVAVIGHDFKWPFGDVQSGEGHPRVKETHMASFRVKQPTTFQCSGLALICGRLEERVEMDVDDLQMLQEFVDGVKPRRYETHTSLVNNENQASHRRDIFFASASSFTLSILMIVLLATDWLNDAGKVTVTIVIVVVVVPEGSYLIMQVVYTNGNRENHWYTCKWWLAPLRFWGHVSVSLFNFLRSLRSSSSTEYTSVLSMA
ncbi:uncharacterized protein [Diadema setosum]|uniref:uncharacterized protein n=1 Tax=Diadema setosum TaxID=31175 RepID=UPI003B3B91DD